MPQKLLDPNDSLERQNEKLRKISEALMRRVEQDTERVGAAYTQFERAAILEDQVRQRTQDLEHALDLLNASNAALEEARHAAERAHANMANAIEAIEEGFGMFDAHDALVLRNSRFGMHMPDIHSRIALGMSFAEYIQAVSQSHFLDLEGGLTRQKWEEQRKARHREAHVMFNVRLISDRWLQVSEHRTPDGGTVVLQTDVTDIIRMERIERGKLLDDQARMIRATLDHLDQGVCIFDKDTNLVGWNMRFSELLAVPAMLLRVGTRFDRLMDHLITDTETSEERAQRFRDWAHRGHARPALRFEVARRTGMILDAFAHEMPDRGFVISFTDVTRERESARALSDSNELLERRVQERTLELEDALSAAERANTSKTRFVAAASHDLLQPLSAAKLYAATLREGDGAPAADKVLNALRNVESIIDALLNISKLDAGTISLDITAVALEPILNDLRDEFAPMAALKGLELRIVPTASYVTSDPGFVRRILQNLIGNAVRYTERGKVLVGARRRGKTLRLEVHDTGPGIAEDDQERIFREFERLSHRNGMSQGLGLGLAIVERACAQLGHPLHMTSVLGQGTRFEVSMEKAVAPRASVRGPEQEALSESLVDTGLLVLIVENDADLRNALVQIIESWGVDTLEAETAEDAILLLEDIGLLPDIAILDHQLGEGATGLDLARHLRNTSPATKTCILSADRSPDLRVACEAQGFPLMQKPVATSILRDFLKSTSANSLTTA